MATEPNYTLTGTILSLSGDADEGYAQIQLQSSVQGALPTVDGTCVIAATTLKASCNAYGEFSVTLFGNDQLEGSTFYTIQLFSAGGQSSLPQDYSLTGGGTHDISDLTPI